MLTKKVGDYTIPFCQDANGIWHMMEYTSAREGEVTCAKPDWPHYRWGYPHAWRKNESFKATVQPTSYYRGRSAVRVRVKNLDNGEVYSMGFGAFFDAVVDGRAGAKGIMTGLWAFRKQGANYILVALDEQ